VAATASSVWFPRPRTVEIRSEALPPVGPDDVRVEAIASAISHGTEMLVFRGQVPDEVELDLPTLRGSFAFPIKYGYASVGRVVEVGAAVDRLAAGQIVFVHHPHQSAYVVPAAMPVVLPAGLEPLAGVFLANVETALNVVLDAAPRLGERVAIFGQGVVGLLITQLVRRTGAGQIVVVDPVASRREQARLLGADLALEPAEPLPEVDLAIEVSGNADALDRAIGSVVFGGTIVVCSWYGTKPAALHLGGAFHRRRLSLVSSQVSTIAPALQPRWTHGRRLDVARDLLGQLQLRPLISHCLPLAQAAEAYALVDEHAAEVIQVVLTYGQS
jgi:2-desacetyl-2-hydroxyethyl bacteriochlorophyllide A dehydrogenase